MVGCLSMIDASEMQAVALEEGGGTRGRLGRHSKKNEMEEGCAPIMHNRKFVAPIHHPTYAIRFKVHFAPSLPKCIADRADHSYFTGLLK